MQCLSCFNPTTPAPSPSSLRKGSMLRRRKLRNAGRVALPPKRPSVRFPTGIVRSGGLYGIGAERQGVGGGLSRFGRLVLGLGRLEQVGEFYRQVDAVADLAGRGFVQTPARGAHLVQRCQQNFE